MKNQAAEIEIPSPNIPAAKRAIIDLPAIWALLEGYTPGFFLLLLLVLGTLLFSGLATAATTQSLSSGRAQVPDFSLSATSYLNSSLHEWNDVNHKADTSLWLVPVLGLSPSLAASLQLIVEKDLTQKQETKVKNAVLGLRHSALPMGKVFSFSPGISAVLPLNSDSRNRDSLIIGMQASPRVLFNLEPIGMDPLSGMLAVTGTRNVHSYRTALGGASNREWGLAPLFRLAAQVSRKLSISATTAYTYRWTYLGNRTDEFELSEDINWQWNEEIALGIGHSNSGSSVKADGVSSNVDVYDPQNSSVYASITVSI